MGSYLLGIDAGNTMVKAVVFDVKGNEIAVASHRIPTENPRPGWIERDMNTLWLYVKKTIIDVVKKSRIESKDVIAVGSAGHGGGLYLLDKRGKPVRKGILSHDSRAASILKRWERGKVNEVFSIIGQKPSSGTPLPLLAWLKENEMKNYLKFRWIFSCKDLVNFKLTASVSTDETVASETLIDVKERKYSDQIFELLDLAECREKLPELVPSWKICGNITNEAARETGLKQGTPVASGLHDVSAVALGCGCFKPGQLVIIMGTWGVNEVIANEPIFDPEKKWDCLNYCMPGLWLLHEASPTSATNLEWFVDQFCYEERLEAKKRGINPYVLCDEEIKKVPIGSNGILFHPFLFGSPSLKPNAKAGFNGIAGWHKRADLLRALYEGVALSHYSHVADFLDRGVTLSDIRIAGGGMRSEPWCQMLADVIGVPVKVPRGTELGARGSGMCAGISVGLFKNFNCAVREMVSIERDYEPIEENTCRYRHLYDVYKTTMNYMFRIWDSLSEIKENT